MRRSCFIVVILFALSQAPAICGATFTVNTTADSGAGSLRQAILDANAMTGSDVIDFAVPGSGVQTIRPVSSLPPITDTITINGFLQSQSDSTRNKTSI